MTTLYLLFVIVSGSSFLSGVYYDEETCVNEGAWATLHSEAHTPSCLKTDSWIF